MDIQKHEEMRAEARAEAERKLVLAGQKFDRAAAEFSAAMDDTEAPDSLRRETQARRTRAAKAVKRAEENLQITIRAWI